MNWYVMVYSQSSYEKLHEVPAQPRGQTDRWTMRGTEGVKCAAVEPESIPVCGVNLVSGPMEQISD